MGGQYGGKAVPVMAMLDIKLIKVNQRWKIGDKFISP